MGRWGDNLISSLQHPINHHPINPKGRRMTEPEDLIFTGETGGSAELFYEDLCDFVRDQQHRLRNDEDADLLLQLDPGLPFSPEALLLMLLAVLRSPAREAFLELFPPRRVPAALAHRVVGVWLDGEIFLPDEALNPLLDAFAHSLPRDAMVQRLLSVTGTSIGAERAF